MRFIIHEQSYELPLASGMWQYFRDSRPTGAVEKWRLTNAADGFRFLRVDLDARAAESGRSYLYHLTMDHRGNPIQLKYRFWDLGFEIIGTVLMEEDAIIVTREIKGQRFEDVLPLPDGYVFWYPASSGLGLLANLALKKTDSAVTLRTQSGSPETQMSPFITSLELKRGKCKKLEIMSELKLTCPLAISWQDQQRTIWIDENNWPLMMERSDGLNAIETRYIQYQRITEPGSRSNEIRS